MRFADPGWLLLVAVPLALGVGMLRNRGAPPPLRIGFPALGFLTDAPTTRWGRWRRLPDALRLVAMVAADRGAGAAAGAARGAAGPEQGPEHHARAGHLQQHEGDRLQARQPAGGGARGPGRVRPPAPRRPDGTGDLRRPLLPAGPAHPRYRSAGRDAGAGGHRAAPRRDRDRDRARAGVEPAQGPAQPGQRDRADHRRRQQHRHARRRSSRRKRPTRSACGSIPSA